MSRSHSPIVGPIVSDYRHMARSDVERYFGTRFDRTIEVDHLRPEYWSHPYRHPQVSLGAARAIGSAGAKTPLRPESLGLLGIVEYGWDGVIHAATT